MEIKAQAVIFAILVALLPQAMTQESTTTTEAPASVISAPSYVSSDIVAYLNRRIRQLLNENPARNPADFNLAGIFNEERRNLESFIITLPASEDNAVKSEQAIENFRNYAQRYMKIEHMLENALDDLNVYEEDLNLPVEVRYQALMLVLKLRNSLTLKEAEKALKLYDDFKSSLSKSITSKTANASDTQLSMPHINDEYKEYFEEILSILKKHAINDTMKVENLLEQILVDIDELKLSTTLRELSNEYYDNEEPILNLLPI